MVVLPEGTVDVMPNAVSMVSYSNSRYQNLCAYIKAIIISFVIKNNKYTNMNYKCDAWKTSETW